MLLIVSIYDGSILAREARKFADNRRQLLIIKGSLSGFVGLDKLLNSKLMAAVFNLGIEVFLGQLANDQSLQFVVCKLRQSGMIDLKYKLFVVD